MYDVSTNTMRVFFFLEKQCCFSGRYELVLLFKGDSDSFALGTIFSLRYEPISDFTELTVQNDQPETVQIWDLLWHSDFHIRCLSSRLSCSVLRFQHCKGGSGDKNYGPSFG